MDDEARSTTSSQSTTIQRVTEESIAHIPQTELLHGQHRPSMISLPFQNELTQMFQVNRQTLLNREYLASTFQKFCRHYCISRVGREKDPVALLCMHPENRISVSLLRFYETFHYQIICFLKGAMKSEQIRMCNEPCGINQMTFCEALNRMMVIVSTTVDMIIFQQRWNAYMNLHQQMPVPLHPEQDLPTDCPDESQAKFNPFQDYLQYCLRAARKNGLSKCGDSMFISKRITRDGLSVETRAWVFLEKILDFVYNCCNRFQNPEQFLNFTSGQSMAKRVAEHLQFVCDPYLPKLSPNRSAWSFRNGIYDALNNRFLPYGDATTGLPPGFSTIKYFDIDFDPSTLTANMASFEPSSIQTPFFDMVLRHQVFEEPVYFWICALMGRNFYDLRQLDQWQISLYFKGKPGTGKSTLAKLMTMFYPKNMIHVLSANIEEKFGLSFIVGKLLWVCFEVKRKFSLQPGDLQSMISGEDMSIPVKNGNAMSLEWNVPGLLSGNPGETPSDWNADAMARRLAIVLFQNIPTQVLPDLDQKLLSEIPQILAKLNQCYQKSVLLYGKRGIWEVLPKYFTGTQQSLRTETNTFAYWLSLSPDQSQVEKLPEAYYLQKDFQEAYRTWCKSSNSRPMKLDGNDVDSCLGTFAALGLEFPNRNTTRLWQGRMVTGRFFEGIGPMDHEHYTAGTSLLKVWLQAESQYGVEKADSQRYVPCEEAHMAFELWRETFRLPPLSPTAEESLQFFHQRQRSTKASAQKRFQLWADDLKTSGVLFTPEELRLWQGDRRKTHWLTGLNQSILPQDDDADDDVADDDDTITDDLPQQNNKRQRLSTTTTTNDDDDDLPQQTNKRQRVRQT
jgi:hypothetical protein